MLLVEVEFPFLFNTLGAYYVSDTRITTVNRIDQVLDLTEFTS